MPAAATPEVSAPAGERIGVFGGTFDPVHLGHLIAAEHAREALGLGAVWFVPARRSPFKAGRAQAADAERVAMLEAALAGQPAFAVARDELARPAPSYTVDTLAGFRAALDGAGRAATELVLLLGADAARELPRWRDPAGIARLARVAVLTRPGHEVDLGALAAAVPALAGRLVALPERLIEVSATEIRARVAAGRSIRYLVPEAVREHIAAHGLYGAPAPGASPDAPGAA